MDQHRLSGYFEGCIKNRKKQPHIWLVDNPERPIRERLRTEPAWV
jgi:hypothetical protein